MARATSSRSPARDGRTFDKADPFATRAEHPPTTASIIWEPRYEWGDGDWMKTRGARSARDAAMSIYEVHLGSWRRDRHEVLGYRELGAQLAHHCTQLGFTHVELMPVMEHPFYGSWGYQVTGYFAPTTRYGAPEDFMAMVDELHRANIGVIVDWVPAHFPTDQHGLGEFDGTHLFEHADPRRGFHPDWTSYIFNYGRHEVRAFLISSAMSWLDRYHIDGLRVDGVASMLYLDYSRKPGEWIPNPDGSNHDRDAIAFLQQFNHAVYTAYPDVQTIAEESTAWGGVTRPPDHGGLGFGYKWDLGWMHDTLAYLAHDPIHRQWHHDALTFRAIYQNSENYVLPLSHDEVVHGKRSLISQDPRRPLAEVRDDALAVRLPVGVARQEAAVHGRRDRRVERVEPRQRARLGARQSPRARRHRALGRRPQPRLSRASRAARRATAIPWASSG